MMFSRSTRRTPGVASRPLTLERLDDRNAPSDAFGSSDVLAPVGYTETGPSPWQASTIDQDGIWPPVSLWPAGGAPQGSEPAEDPARNPPTSNKQPVIKNFTHRHEGTQVIFTGKVEDENPVGLTVRFGGPPAMGDASAVTDSGGNFTLVISLNGQTGEVWARTADFEGLASDYVYDTVN